MQPDYHINAPKVGEKITAAWGGNVVKSINALQPSVGYGMRISRNDNGVLYELDQTTSKVKGGFDMPFDVSIDRYDDTTHKLYLVVYHGDVYYNLGASTTKIPDAIQNSKEIFEVDYDFETDDSADVILGIQFNYASDGGDGSYAPQDWQFAILPDINSENYADLIGVKYFPIFELRTHNRPEDPEEAAHFDEKAYPIKFSFEAGDNHVIGIQLYHGDIWLSYSDGACYIAEVDQQSQIGEFDATILDFGDDTASYQTVRVNVTELAFTESLPTDSRVLVHPVYVTAYDSGEVSQEEGD